MMLPVFNINAGAFYLIGREDSASVARA